MHKPLHPIADATPRKDPIHELTQVRAVREVAIEFSDTTGRKLVRVVYDPMHLPPQLVSVVALSKYIHQALDQTGLVRSVQLHESLHDFCNEIEIEIYLTNHFHSVDSQRALFTALREVFGSIEALDTLGKP